MSRPIMLDLFACGGGSGVGYERAGYDVYAIDNDPKPLKVNPHPFLLMDAMLALEALVFDQPLTFSDGRTLWLKDIAAIHASPPCQGYSIMNNLPWIRARKYPLLIDRVRSLVKQTGVPYIIENVAGAASKRNLAKLGLLEHRLRAGWLCGGMFGLPIYRHRYFETSFFWPQPGHPKHAHVISHGRQLGGRANVDRGIVASPYGAATTPGQRGMHGAHGGNAVTIVGRTRSSLLAGYLETTANPIGHSGGNGAQKSGVAVGHAAGWHLAAEAMGIDWMNRATLTQAIPPVMTEHIGRWSPPILALEGLL